MAYLVRKATPGDCKQIVLIHLRAFDGFFLTLLGKRFLIRYYNAVINNSNSIAYCVTENDNLVGFCVGTKCAKGFHKLILKENFFSFLWQGIIILLTNPKAIYRLVLNLEKKGNIHDDGMYAELLSIGVLPSCAGKGIGTLLIKAFEKEAIHHRISKVSLTTDYDSNENTLEFYKKQGYLFFYDFYTYPQRRMYRLMKSLLSE